MAGLVPAIHECVAAIESMSQHPPMREAWIYIVTNKPNGILYLGVTSNLRRRIWEHREGILPGFTKRHATITAAIQREKNMKHWSRTWKVRLILAANPSWDDLYETIV